MSKISKLYAKTSDVKKSNSSLGIQRKKPSQPIKSPADRILFLQRTIGNHAVQRLIKSGTLQAKLKIGQPWDVYEQEADRVADAVMQMPEPGVQRQVEPEEEEEEMLQAKPLAEEITPLVQRQIEPEEEEEEIQPKSLAGTSPEVTPEMGRDIQSIKGTGQPLSVSERAFFEPRFGADFDDVRVHSDAQAAHVAQSVNARAFTLGHDVVFGAGQYSPATSSGRKLLAHELTHVVQQTSRLSLSQSKIQRRELRGEDFPWQGVVENSSWVWFRKEAKMNDANKIKALAKGTEVKITGKSGNWLKVEYNGKSGYIYKNYVIHKFEVKARKDISGVCDKAACLTKSGCTTSKCKIEATIIAEKYVSRVNKIRKPNIANVGDQHWGWLCYQWAGLLTREFSKLSLNCWKINWVGIVGGSGSLDHNYIFVSLEDITPSGTEAPKRGCGMILDPWRTGDPIVYDVSWSWHKWNYIHKPSTNKGKSYTGGTWSDVTYLPPWTPVEPAASPTIKVP